MQSQCDMLNVNASPVISLTRIREAYKRRLANAEIP